MSTPLMPCSEHSRFASQSGREQIRAVLSLVTGWPSEEARDWTSQFVARLCFLKNVQAVVLFGSIIRPVSKSSDVDLLVIYSGERPHFAPPPIDVDVRAYQDTTVESLLHDGHDLLGWTVRLGWMVCEQNAFWSNLAAAWKDRLKLPSAEVADERAAQAAQLLVRLRAIGDDDAVTEQTVAMLTHQARAKLIRAGVFPTSRPELAQQLEEIGEWGLAREFDKALAKRNATAHDGETPADRRHFHVE